MKEREKICITSLIKEGNMYTEPEDKAHSF